MTQLDKIKNKINQRLYEMRLCDIKDLDVDTIITSSTANIKDCHEIKLSSGMFDGKIIKGKDTEGRNINLPVEYIVDIV